MSQGDLQSFLASFQAQAEAPPAAARPNNPASYALAAPESTVSVAESFGPGDANQPVCTPITRMASEFSKASSGRLIAVNENYICYAIKGNLIRVIHFVQVTRNKLAPHPAALVDMEFSGRGDDVLASLDAGGTLRVRTIFEAHGECQYATELEVRLPGGEGQKVCWAGPGSNAVAVAAGNAVVIMSTERALLLASAGAEHPVLQPSALAEVGSVCSGHVGAVTDACFSPDFSQLLTASADGSVCVWGPTSAASPAFAMPHATVPCKFQLRPHGGAPVSSAFFVGPNLLTGADRNSVLQLWTPDLAAPGSYAPAHRVVLPRVDAAAAGGALWTHVAVDAAAGLVLCAPTTEAALVVLHLADRNFDLATKYDLAYPILSFAPVAHDGLLTTELQAFCIQTKAIQKYTLVPSDCTPPKPQTIAAAPPTPAAAPLAAAVASPRAASPDVLVVPAAPQPASPAASSPVAAVGAPVVNLAAVVAMEARLVAAMAAAVDERLQTHQQAVARETDAKLATLADSLVKDVAAAVGAAVAAQQKQAAAAAEAKVKQAVREGNQAQTAALKAASAAESAKLGQEVVAAVARDVREPVLAAFRQCFAEQLVPSLQQATQRMFTQIDAGLDARFANLPAAASAVAAALAPPPDPKAELEALLEAKQVDEALMKALGARDLGLVTWLCAKVDPREMSAPLSQTVLVCLLQQLGQSLEVDTALKLEWFKMIALSLEKEAAEIAAYAPKVVAELQQRIREFLATDKGRTVRQDLVMLLRLL